MGFIWNYIIESIINHSQHWRVKGNNGSITSLNEVVRGLHIVYCNWRFKILDIRLIWISGVCTLQILINKYTSLNMGINEQNRKNISWTRNVNYPQREQKKVLDWLKKRKFFKDFCIFIKRVFYLCNFYCITKSMQTWLII